VLPADMEPVSLQRVHPANPGVQPSDHIAAHSSCVEFALRVPRLPPDKSLVELRQSYNAINGVNTTSTEYSPVCHETVSRQFQPLEVGERLKECSQFPPELVRQAQEPVPPEVPVLPWPEPIVPLQAQAVHPVCLPDDEHLLQPRVAKKWCLLDAASKSAS
jgi:hypothetical protein